jgi:hypothetical protein
VVGTAGYTFPGNSENSENPGEGEKLRQITGVEYSIDNGKTFHPAKGKEEWKFRLETQDIKDGVLGILVRVHFKSGEVAVSKTQVHVDDTAPEVTLLEPEEGMRFNDSIDLSGIAYDVNGLQEVSVSLRKGDKSKYQVPEFIQGLYIDTHVLGSTYGELGIGLTFFDDNVKLQFQAGIAPSGGRFDGYVLGAKLLANIVAIPYSYFFGPSLNFLSSSIAVGATFNYFTMTDTADTEKSEGLVLGAVIGQIELARFDIHHWRMFNSFSIYTEGQVWFISSDIDAGALFKMAFGLRTEIF